LLLMIPGDEGTRSAQAMETCLQACASEDPFAFELVSTSHEQGFVLRTRSESQAALLCGQLEAEYPQVEWQPIPLEADPLLLCGHEHALVGDLDLCRPSWLPIKTFGKELLAEPGADPLAGLLAAMEPLLPGERLIAQLALARAPQDWLAADIRKSVEHPLQAERDRAIPAHRDWREEREGDMRLFLGLLVLLLGFVAYRWYSEHRFFALIGLACALLVVLTVWGWRASGKPIQPIYDVKLVAEKMARAGFYCQVRLIAIGPVTTTPLSRLREHLTRMEIAYQQFTLDSANGLRLSRIRHLRAGERAAQTLVQPLSAFSFAPAWRRLLHGGALSKQILNALELAGLFHLPPEEMDLPLVRRSARKALLFEPLIARQILEARAPLPPALLGYSRHRRRVVPALLPYAVLFGHKFLVGMSRSGKSVAMQLLTAAAMQPVRDHTPQPGVFVIDPHHDLVVDLLSLIPPERMQDVLLLDLMDDEYPIALNPLDASMGFSRDQATSNLMAAFGRIWSDFWGPRMSHFLMNVLLTLYTLNERLVAEGRAQEQFTLLDINPMLERRDYAREALSRLDPQDTWDQERLAWWQSYDNLPANSSFRQEIIMPILSKMGVFADNTRLRRIVGQPVTQAPVHEAVTGGKILLCALSARDMDDASVNILGSTLLNLLHRAFSLQQHLPLTTRRRVFVAVDELQAFSGSDFDKMLAEDAKLGCAMLLSTQSISRLKHVREGLIELILSTCPHLCVFRVAAADARLLHAELQERVAERHLTGQPTLHCYARLALSGYPLQVVSLELAQPKSFRPDPATAAQIQALRDAGRKLTLSAAEVDRRYGEHVRRFLDISAYVARIEREAHTARLHKQQREAAEARAEAVRANRAPLSPSSQPVNAPALSGKAAPPSAPMMPGKGAAGNAPPRPGKGATQNAPTPPGKTAPQSGPMQGTDAAKKAGGKRIKHHRGQGKGAAKDSNNQEAQAGEENISGASRSEPRPFSPGTGRERREAGRAWERERG
jgi:hypothetical protein